MTLPPAPVYLHCPECAEPAIPELAPGQGWLENQNEQCPSCGVWLRVDKTYDPFNGVKTDIVVEAPKSRATYTGPQAVNYDQGKPKIDLLLTPAALPIAEALTYGAHKYPDDFNYLHGDGLSYRRNASSMIRHIVKWLCGENIDSESGIHHLGHVGARVVMALNLVLLNKGIDDRIHKAVP